MKLTKEQIKKGFDEAYKKAGNNAYFGNGFEAGVAFAFKHLEYLNTPDANTAHNLKGIEKVDKYHIKTLLKVNKLYKYLYDRMVCATELADEQDGVFAYINLTDDVKMAYKKFRNTVCELANKI